HGGATLNGRSQNLWCQGPISWPCSDRGRCSPGQSRTVARSVAMVSHLRKMTLLSRILAEGATGLAALSPLLPLSTARLHNPFRTRAQQSRLNSLVFQIRGAVPIGLRRILRKAVEARQQPFRRPIARGGVERGGEGLARILKTSRAVGGETLGITGSQLDLPGC